MTTFLSATPVLLIGLILMANVAKADGDNGAIAAGVEAASAMHDAVSGSDD